MMKYMMMALAVMIAAPLISPAHADDRLHDIQVMQENIKTLTENLDEVSHKHFTMIYNNHNLLSVVDVIEDDVENAVKACGENNPEIKTKMRDRFKAWSKDVNGVQKEARGHLDNMVMVQSYADPKNIKEIMRLSNSIRIETNNQYKKVPVTSLEGCNYLHAKMDETQDNLTSLLRSTMISAPAQAQQALDESAAHAE